jgi:hypothetical protein
MELKYDPQDIVQHIGEALALIVTAIAQEHDAPLQLLDAMQRAVEKCDDFPAMYSPVTKALVRYASKGLEGSILAASGRDLQN